MSTTVKDNRLRRKRSIRFKLRGTPERPRLSVYRSNKHVYAQVINDVSGATVAYASSLDKDVPEKLRGVALAKKIGEMVAERALAQKVNTVVFDRNGFLYHGQVKAIAMGAREKGLKF